MVCTAYGNPSEVDFAWSVKAENETYEVMSSRQKDALSYLLLDEEFIETRVYRCIANNTVGTGSYCEIDVAGEWLKVLLKKLKLYPQKPGEKYEKHLNFYPKSCSFVLDYKSSLVAPRWILFNFIIKYCLYFSHSLFFFPISRNMQSSSKASK